MKVKMQDFRCNGRVWRLVDIRLSGELCSWETKLTDAVLGGVRKEIGNLFIAYVQNGTITIRHDIGFPSRAQAVAWAERTAPVLERWEE